MTPHYSDVTWALRCRKSLEILLHRLFRQTNEDTSKLHITGHLWGESTRNWCIPLTKDPVIWTMFLYHDIPINGTVNEHSTDHRPKYVIKTISVPTHLKWKANITSHTYIYYIYIKFHTYFIREVNEKYCIYYSILFWWRPCHTLWKQNELHILYNDKTPTSMA